MAKKIKVKEEQEEQEGHNHGEHEGHEHPGHNLPQNNQEDMIRANLLEQEIRQVEQQIGLVDSQITELQLLSLRLDDIDKANKNDEMLASIGKNVFIKTELKDKELFVDIGAKTIVKKTIKETKEIIDKDINKLAELKERIVRDMNSLIQEITKMQF